jgi:hypothetical protein
VLGRVYFPKIGQFVVDFLNVVLLKILGGEEIDDALGYEGEFVAVGASEG